MKRYFKNLVLAIRGRNPFAEEVADLREKLEKAGENVSWLSEMYYSALEKWEAAEKRAASQQQLVENLRERIRDKDAELEEQGRAFREHLEQTRRDYDKRIATYAQKIERLQKRQENAKRKIEGMLSAAEHQPMATKVLKRTFMDLLNSILKCLND